MTQEFDMGQVEVFHTIGAGGHGKVKLARARSDQVYFALKCMKKAHLIRAQQVDHVHSELQIQKSLSHPFIVRLLGYSQDNTNLYFALELINGGDLFTHIRLSKSLSSLQSLLYSAQILITLEYIHSNNIIYRDLKPENLLIKHNGYLKLTDFGLSKVTPGRTYTFCGTSEYLAPEVLLKNGYGKAVDWWSFGVIIYEMLVGVSPFFNSDPMVIFEKILQAKIRFPRGFDKTAKSLIKHLLVKDLSKRYGNMKNGVNDIKRHKWFKEVDWVLLFNERIQMPAVPAITFQGDTSNFYNYPESFTVSEPVIQSLDPFLNW